MIDGFPKITGSLSEGRYFIEYDGLKLSVFSGRSAARDIAQLESLISAAPPAHVPVIVAPYRDEFAALFNGHEKFFFLAPICFSTAPPDDARLIWDTASLKFFINQINIDDKFEITVIPQWQTLTEAIKLATKHIFDRAAVRLKTIRHFGRLWPINFRLNSPHVTADITLLRSQRPEMLVMAGPSLDAAFPELPPETNIWSADTALPALVARGIWPQVVFSVDAGFASSEHFVGLTHQIAAQKTTLVCDMLGNAAVQRLPFGKQLSYQSSHPLVQEFCSSKAFALTPIENPRGDVGSLMRNVFALLFANADVRILGHDGKSLRKISHARGTAYYKRAYIKQTRLQTAETYMLKLSARY